MSDGTYAKVIADSITIEGHRLTTFEVRFHRFVLAEFNTHRVFSRNSASSRAIPFSKQMERVKLDPAIPAVWASEQRGMQGGDEVADVQMAEEVWRSARLAALDHAAMLSDSYGVHKSIVNRLIEPFMWHTVIVTATAWDNFFRQRVSPLAQPELRVCAEKMKAVYDASEPVTLYDHEWHLPYIQEEDWAAIDARNENQADADAEAIKVSVARCARVSYLTHDGRRDISEDVTLYERLVTADPPHWSPLEHAATPDPENIHEVTIKLEGAEQTLYLPSFGNFLGWRQHRIEVEVSKGIQTYA